MTDLDLSKAEWAATAAIRAIPDYANEGTTSDFAKAGVRGALPHILEALADAVEWECGATTSPCFCGSAKWLRDKAEDARA